MTRRAALIAVGSELLRLDFADTNTAWLAARLALHGVVLQSRCVVADDVEAIAAAIRAAARGAEWVFLLGGLGPTEDDRTRDAVALACDAPLERCPRRLQELRDAFEHAGVAWGEGQARQADLPRGFAWIDNPGGSAAGLRGTCGDAALCALPGVPAELRAMVERERESWLGAPAEAATGVRCLRVAGRAEGELDASLADLHRHDGIETTVLCGAWGVDVWLLGRGASAERLARVAEEARARLGPDCYATEADRSLAEVVGARLAERGETLALAESCTAGLLAAEIGSVPGASAWFLGGVVSYADEIKRTWIGVDARDLERHGAVSEPVARAMAEGVRGRAGSDWGVGITGIAGPGGGSAEKPVGLVHVALAGRSATHHWRRRFHGDRATVRLRSAAFALDRLRRALIAADP